MSDLDVIQAWLHEAHVWRIAGFILGFHIELPAPALTRLARRFFYPTTQERSGYKPHSGSRQRLSVQPDFKRNHAGTDSGRLPPGDALSDFAWAKYAVAIFVVLTCDGG
jgi:hypothetical protein